MGGLQQCINPCMYVCLSKCAHYCQENVLGVSVRSPCTFVRQDSLVLLVGTFRYGVRWYSKNEAIENCCILVNWWVITCSYVYVHTHVMGYWEGCIVEPPYKSTPEIWTPRIMRTLLCVPATCYVYIIVYKNYPWNVDTSLIIRTLSSVSNVSAVEKGCTAMFPQAYGVVEIGILHKSLGNPVFWKALIRIPLNYV